MLVWYFCIKEAFYRQMPNKMKSVIPELRALLEL